MAAPLKPWEQPGMNYQKSSLDNITWTNEMASSSRPVEMDSIHSTINRNAPVAAVASVPPNVPPRPSQQQNTLSSRFGMGPGFSMGGMNNIGGGYGGFGGYSSGYGSYGGMYNSPYSSYGSVYSGYNNNRICDAHSQFARQAEESSRPAFESIESIVSAVNSVGMMLDSTFQAVYNSFRAVIGVADNFSRLKSQLVQVFSALAFIRTLRYMYRRLLEILKLRPAGEANRQWMEAFSEASSIATGRSATPKKSSWPIVMFFGIIMGGPYLIWKIISSFAPLSNDESAWAKGETDHFVARANYNFQAQNKEEISFSQGQSIILAPKELQPHVRGWLLASVDGKTTGLIPANYVKVFGKRQGTKKRTQQPSNSQPSPLKQTVSSAALSQEFSEATSQNLSFSESQMENVYSIQSAPTFPSGDFSMENKCKSDSLDQDQSNPDASDILNDVR